LAFATFLRLDSIARQVTQVALTNQVRAAFTGLFKTGAIWGDASHVAHLAVEKDRGAQMMSHARETRDSLEELGNVPSKTELTLTSVGEPGGRAHKRWLLELIREPFSFAFGLLSG